MNHTKQHVSIRQVTIWDYSILLQISSDPILLLGHYAMDGLQYI